MRGTTWVLVLFLGTSLAAREKSTNSVKTHTRPILADTLRDYPGACFASTQCGTVEVGGTWDLKPFCGRSTCAKAEDGRLVEVVEDCGPAPDPACTLDEKRTKASASFPDCCPVWNCPDAKEGRRRESDAREGRRQENDSLSPQDTVEEEPEEEYQEAEPQREVPRTRTRTGFRRKTFRTRE